MRTLTWFLSSKTWPIFNSLEAALVNVPQIKSNLFLKRHLYLHQSLSSLSQWKLKKMLYWFSLERRLAKSRKFRRSSPEGSSSQNMASNQSSKLRELQAIHYSLKQLVMFCPYWLP